MDISEIEVIHDGRSPALFLSFVGELCSFVFLLLFDALVEVFVVAEVPRLITSSGRNAPGLGLRLLFVLAQRLVVGGRLIRSWFRLLGSLGRGIIVALSSSTIIKLIIEWPSLI
jgi:hypothetical protein